MEREVASALRALPAVEEVLSQEILTPWLEVIERGRVVDTIRETIDAARASIRNGQSPRTDAAALAAEAATCLETLIAPNLRPVVNATGIVIHTNLGRSPLARSAIEAVRAVSEGYSTLEYDLTRQQRGSRQDHCERLLRTLTGAEAALVVNNNAAAVLLTLAGLAAGHEVVVSRGELIEIGESFRIPDIMAASGATMVEVGTTNKTHRADFERAIGDDTALLLKVHPSNYAVVGFSESVDAATLAEIAKTETKRRADGTAPDRELLVYEDLGSGCLVPLDAIGAHERTVAEALASGCSLVSFSGDKLLGGPQAGILVGRADLIERLRHHPLTRALRPDKMTLVALEATLTLYLNPERALRELPTLRMLTEPADEARARAAELLSELGAFELTRAGITAEIAETTGCAGGGSLPLLDLPGWAIALAFSRGSAASCQRFLATEPPTPVIARIHDDRLLLDVRCVLSPADRAAIVAALAAYLNSTRDVLHSTSGLLCCRRGAVAMCNGVPLL